MDEIRDGDPTRLARLLNSQPSGTDWSCADLRAMLEHQLSTALSQDLRTPSLDSEQYRNQLAAMTFGQLLQSPAPSLKLLTAVKEFAKTSDSSEQNQLPTELATVLYYASIAAAELRLGQRITQLSTDELRSGFAWALAREWLLPQLASLFRDALNRLGSTSRAS